MSSIAIIGAGFSGAVIARQLADAGLTVTVYEARGHIAGNCHTQRDEESEVMVHTYGPHIFHTQNESVWKYITQFDRFRPFVNRVKAIHSGKVYSLPINLLTINNFFGKTFSPREAQEHLKSLQTKWDRPAANFEEQALGLIGRELYEAFFKGYTTKQWGISPSELPASILKRLPVRFSYDDNYFADNFQGIPEHGYTHVIRQILEHPNIRLLLNTRFEPADAKHFQHTFYSGPLDAWFNHCHGRLGYRTLDFSMERHEGDFQGNAVINYCDLESPWTRITEHKHFSPWETHEKTIIYREFSRSCTDNDTPYYPIRLASEMQLLEQYLALARQTTGVTFVGRLGTYRYIDMDATIAEALALSARYIASRSNGLQMPSILE